MNHKEKIEVFSNFWDSQTRNFLIKISAILSQEAMKLSVLDRSLFQVFGRKLNLLFRRLRRGKDSPFSDANNSGLVKKNVSIGSDGSKKKSLYNSKNYGHKRYEVTKNI